MIAQRFLEGVNYIKSLGNPDHFESPQTNFESKAINEDLIELLKLKYLFNPPNENEKERY